MSTFLMLDIYVNIHIYNIIFLLSKYFITVRMDEYKTILV